ncbi:hypothetical protein ACO0LF_20385 [Undibacterium sp. Di27W]|uniref:hypothetical protein n=1 Tax=Undibacterium sp. Di27W TaxID=3413036 RepID=UPI003BF1546B
MSDLNTVALSSYSARAKGAMFFSVFGSAWLALWIQRSLQASWLVYLLIALGGLALFCLACLRNRQYLEFAEEDSPATKKAARWFHIVNGGQWLLILISSNVLINLGHAVWVMPVAMLIIGLHFLPLARLFKVPGHLWLGLLISLFAITYPFLLSGGPADPYGCLGMGLLLWGYALLKLLSIPAIRRQNLSTL